MSVSNSSVDLKLNFYPRTVKYKTLPKPGEHETNNLTIFHAPKQKNVLIKISPTEAVLVTNAGNAFTGTSSNTTDASGQIRWKVKSRLLGTNNFTNYKCKEETFKKKRAFRRNRVGFFTLETENNSGESEEQKCEKVEPIIDLDQNDKDVIMPEFNMKYVNTDEYMEDEKGSVVNDPPLKYKCDECGEKFLKLKLLTLHTQITGHFSCKCKWCGEGFQRKESLTAHILQHAGRYVFACECGKKFSSQKNLSTHKLVHGTREHQCSFCGASFKTRRHLTRHENTHLPYNERPFGCTVPMCKTRFLDPTSLKYHMLQHNKQYDFLCDNCGKSFLKNCDLKRHRKEEHGESGGNDINGKVLPVRGRKLIRRYRNNEMPENGYLTGDDEFRFGCNICGSKKKRLSDLREHILRHVGERNFKCPQCDLRFVRIAELKGHETVHTGQKNHTCEICGNKFREPRALKRHAAVHNPELGFYCQICDRRYPYKGSYVAHLQLHEGKKLFECSVCHESVMRSTKIRSRQGVNMNCDFCSGKLKFVRSKTRTQEFIEGSMKDVLVEEEIKM